MGGADDKIERSQGEGSQAEPPHNKRGLLPVIVLWIHLHSITDVEKDAEASFYSTHVCSVICSAYRDCFISSIGQT